MDHNKAYIAAGQCPSNFSDLEHIGRKCSNEKLSKIINIQMFQIDKLSVYESKH
jgi:hypothetical protein